MDGIYIFGGRNSNGLVSNKLKYLKPHVVNHKVISVEWPYIKQNGNPPCPRTGHSMSYLPCNNAIMIAGGRNDEVCKNMNTPYLDDIHLFLLDQKAWIPVKYTPFSQRIHRMGNHTSCTMTNSFSYEKTVLFGGITYSTVRGDEEHKHNKE